MYSLKRRAWSWKIQERGVAVKFYGVINKKEEVVDASINLKMDKSPELEAMYPCLLKRCIPVYGR